METIKILFVGDEYAAFGIHKSFNLANLLEFTTAKSAHDACHRFQLQDFNIIAFQVVVGEDTARDFLGGLEGQLIFMNNDEKSFFTEIKKAILQLKGIAKNQKPGNV